MSKKSKTNDVDSNDDITESNDKAFEDNEDILGFEGFPDGSNSSEGVLNPDEEEEEEEFEFEDEDKEDEEDEEDEDEDEEYEDKDEESGTVQNAERLLDGVDVEYDEDDFSDEDEDGEYEYDDETISTKSSKDALKKYMKPAIGVVAAVAVGSLGYGVVLPMFSSEDPQGSSERVVTNNYSPNNQVSPEIPGSEDVSIKNTIPIIPNVNASEGSIKIPGLNSNVSIEDSRPSVEVGTQVELGFLPPVNNSDIPSINLDISENSDIKLPSNTTPPVSDNIDIVGNKIDSLLSKFDQLEADLEAKFATKEDVLGMISSEIEKTSAEIDVQNPVLIKINEAIGVLNSRITNLENRSTNAMPVSDANIEKIVSDSLVREAAINQKINKIEELINKKMGDAEVKGVDTSSSANKDNSALKRKLAAQRREIEALKTAKGGSVVPSNKPRILPNYRLAGMSHDRVWIQTEVGVSMFQVGQQIPGAGEIIAVHRSSSSPSVLTSNGVIIP